MENRRIRNYYIYSAKSDELDALLSTIKADQVEYTQGRYKVHFKVPISPSALKQRSGCQNVEAIFKRKPKIQIGAIPNIEKPKIVKQKVTKLSRAAKKLKTTSTSFYNQLFQKYQKKVTKGYVIEQLLKHNKMDADMLEKPDANLLKFYRTIKELSTRVSETASGNVVTSHRRVELMETSSPVKDSKMAMKNDDIFAN